MILRFPPNHGNRKWHLMCAIFPPGQQSNTRNTAYIWGPALVKITHLTAKVTFITLFHKSREISPLRLESQLTTNIAEIICMIYTLSGHDGKENSKAQHTQYTLNRQEGNIALVIFVVTSSQSAQY